MLRSVTRPTRLGQAPAAIRRHASTLAEARKRWNNRLVVTEEVEAALEEGRAVVALETAIVTHGMPYPHNLDTATKLEGIVRSHGAVPATIALLDGKIRIGMPTQELDHALAHPEGIPPRQQPSVKVSRRDLAPALAFNRAGGTTVAGTMVIAHSVGIDSFVTGGIGGVHRGAESSMDISADLLELGRTPMMVVCAGAKSILDIPRSLEVLETQGVCVTTFGDKDDFPAFYSPSSGVASPWRVGSIEDAARLVHVGLTLPTPQSTLLAVPIPAQYGEAGAAVQVLVEQAVRESIELGIDKKGKEVTPWLLKRVGELTKGTALELNKVLIENNVHIGSKVAVEVARLRLNAKGSAYGAMPAIPAVPGAAVSASASGPALMAKSSTTPPAPAAPVALPPPSVLVFGSAAIDLTSSTAGALVPRTTTPGSVSVTPGGVGRNIAEAAQGLLPAHAVQLVSAVGAGPIAAATDMVPSDTFGQLLQLEMRGAGLRTDGLVAREGATAVCSLVLTGGDLAGGVADMDIVEHVDAQMVTERINAVNPRMVVFDCNLLPQTISAILAACASQSIPAFCDPTSTPKLARVLPGIKAHPRALTHLSPNTLELESLYDALQDEDGWSFVNGLNLGAEWRNAMDTFVNKSNGELEWMRNQGVAQKLVGCLPWVGGFWVKAGDKGLLHLRLETELPKGGKWPGKQSVSHKTPDGRWLVLSHYAAPVITPEEVVNTTGAGDTLAGGLVAGLVRDGDEGTWVAEALERVGRTLRSHRAVG